MLRHNKLKARLKQDKPVLGLLNSIPSPLIVEMIGYAGYDFVILDMEHVGVNPETLENMIRSAECAGLTPLVRVPNIDASTIMRVLDCGAQGIVAPRIRNRAEAEQIVSASRYYPLGMRGISGGRCTGFGTLDLVSYMELANREIMVVAMIEDQNGVENIEEIASVPGIDMILEGAVDLSQSYGVPARPMEPIVQKAIQRVASGSHAQAVPFCAIPRAEGQFEAWRKQGVHAFLMGDDRGISFRALKAQTAMYK